MPASTATIPIQSSRYSSQATVDLIQAASDAVDKVKDSAVRAIAALDAGANPNVLVKSGHGTSTCTCTALTALCRAPLNASRAVARMIQAGAAIDALDHQQRTALAVAAFFGANECVDLLLAAGADPNTQDNDGDFVLGLACLQGHPHAALALIAAGADPNALDQGPGNIGYTPLHSASDSGSPDIIRALVGAGARIDVPSGLNSSSPLIIAAANGRARAVEALLALGADANLSAADGLSALHEAATLRSASCVKLLIRAGARVDASDHLGKTPAHLAARHPSRSTCLALARTGADFHALDNDGLSPMDILQTYTPELGAEVEALILSRTLSLQPKRTPRRSTRRL